MSTVVLYCWCHSDGSFVFYTLIMHACALFINEIKSCIYVILGFILLDLVCKYPLFYGFLIELFV